MHLELNRRKVRLAQLPPDTRGGMAGAGKARAVTELQRNTGATNHGIEPVAMHELGQGRPQGQDDTALAMIPMHATAAQFHHTLTQRAQPCQVEFGVGVGAADTACLCRRQYPVGTDDFTTVAVANQQMLTIVVKDVDVVSGDWRAQAGAHFARENVITQALRLAHFVQMTGPARPDRAGGAAGPQQHGWCSRGGSGRSLTPTQQRERQRRCR